MECGIGKILRHLYFISACQTQDLVNKVLKKDCGRFSLDGDRREERKAGMGGGGGGRGGVGEVDGWGNGVGEWGSGPGRRVLSIGAEGGGG